MQHTVLMHYTIVNSKYFIFFGFGDFNDCMVKEFRFGKEKYVIG